jgi:hypothetical protein
MNQLNQKLLNNLEQHYEQLALMYEEGLSIEEQIKRLQIPSEEVYDMHLIVFDRYPIYSANNIFGQKVYYQLNADTGRSWEVNSDGTTT